MKPFTFHIPTRIVFGRGEISRIGEFIDPRAKNILIISDKNVPRKSGAVDKIIASLKGCQCLVFDEIEENPSFDSVQKGAVYATENRADLVIGLGGGSPMDAAKGIALLVRNSGELTAYVGGKELEKSPLPIVCIPTTSGTGSEVTPFAVFSDPEQGEKVGYSRPELFPRVSIIDPELTYSMPEEVIVNSGLDALIHSIEAYLSTESFPLNDRLALHAIEISIANLKKARLREKAAMDAMAYAATLGGIAIANAGT
jgi:alcohol dehydrogenase class IV